MRMKNIYKKILAVILCPLLAAGTFVAGIYAAGSDSDGKADDTETVAAENISEEKTVNEKDETVYVIAGADGTVEKIIVSDWIKNRLGDDTLSDVSALEGVENVKGDEAYTVNSDNMRVWDAKGGDIYCSGTLEKELPVSLLVTWELDGKKVSPAELAGKSGKLKIHFDYKNNQYKTVEIDGKEEKIYVPFAVLCGMVLDTDVFTNVEVTSGKLIGDGDRVFVAGVAFPGLNENLGLDKDKYEIPESIEITADVKNFEMTNTVTIATNEVFNKIDTTKFDSADDIYAAVGTLTDAMTRLTDGSSALYEGLDTLLVNVDKLAAGIDKLYAGAATLKDGTASLSKGADSLSGGAKTLADGLAEIASNNDKLSGGALQVFNTLLATVENTVSENGITIEKLTPENYKSVLTNLVKNPNDTQKAQLAGAARKTLEAELSASGVPEQYYGEFEYMLATRMAGGMTQEAATAEATKLLQHASLYMSAPAAPEAYAPLKAAITAKVGDEAAAERICAVAVSLAGEGGDPTQYINAAIAVAADAKTFSTEAAAAAGEQGKAIVNAFLIQSAAAKIGPSLDRAISQLDSYNEFYTGLRDYTAGVGTAADGAAKLSDGAGELSEGAATLDKGAAELLSGILEMKNGAPALKSGTTQLRDGAKTLSEGLNKFNEEGVSKIADAVNGDLKTFIARARATADVSKDYRSFSGLSDDMDGSVRFIYRTDSIK